MPRFEVTTTVEFVGEVEAETREEAEAMGWDWEEHLNFYAVDSIEVYEYPQEDEDEEE